MATNDYVLEHSTDSIWRENDFTRVLSDDLNTMDALIAGKADSDHNHDGDYAALSHTHTEYAASTHNHDELYAAKTHETNSTVHVTAEDKAAWNSKAAGDHNHDSVYADIDHVHTNYATTEHTHNTATTTTAGYLSATDKTKLDGIATGANAYTHPATHPASMITGLPTIPTSLPANGGNADTVDNCHASDFAAATHDHDSDYAALNHNHNGVYATATHSHTNYSTTGHTHSTATTTTAGFMSGTDKTKLNGIATGANAYTHPATHPASMISETDGLKVMTAAERTKLSGIAENANNYSHPASHPASMITGLSEVATSGSYEDLTDIPSTFNPAQHTHSNATTTAAGFMSKDDKTKLNGIATGANAYTHPSSHPMSMITGLLDVLLTDSYGGVKNEYTSGDMLNIAKNWAKGMYTAYFKGGSVTNTPTDKESWRCISHKTGALFGWLLAFGTSGSIYNNYLDNGTWRGWRNIYDANPAPLWGTTGYYMTAGHTVRPSKKLSECRNGWVLLWSDYDPDTSSTNEKDWVTTVIPKITPSGAKWSNKLFYCDIPRYVGDNTADVDNERRIIKQIYISDDKIVGHNSNSQDERSDVVLRAVLEI